MAFKSKNVILDAQGLRDIVDGAPTRSEGMRRLYDTIAAGVNKEAIGFENIPIRNLAYACGVWDDTTSWSEMAAYTFGQFKDTEKSKPAGAIFSESNANLNTDVFQTILTQLIDSMTISRDTSTLGLVGRSLCQVVSANRRTSKMVGTTGLGRVMPVVREGQRYTETTFGEKYVETDAKKFGTISASITLELMLEDDRGEIMRRVNQIYDQAQLEMEEYILSMITDQQNSEYGYVYKPSGVNTALYSSGNDNLLTSTALADYTDIDAVYNYRIQNVVDDRVDGTPKPMWDINVGQKILLVPDSLSATAMRIRNSLFTDVKVNTNDAMRVPDVTVGRLGTIVSSPVLDTFTNGTTTWYYGIFNKQFVLRELLPIQVFTQGGDSDASFEQDTVMRVKVRAYMGVNAVDAPYVTKVTA